MKFCYECDLEQGELYMFFTMENLPLVNVETLTAITERKRRWVQSIVGNLVSKGYLKKYKGNHYGITSKGAMFCYELRQSSNVSIDAE